MAIENFMSSTDAEVIYKSLRSREEHCAWLIRFAERSSDPDAAAARRWVSSVRGGLIAGMEDWARQWSIASSQQLNDAGLNATASASCSPLKAGCREGLYLARLRAPR